ncbi:MAG: cob(I)yrinic acid a,c-diamide adenosyltransferase [Alphaproteobacteria bacterium]|nr:cob(I)yrinic acid a,c-diamide adenosyltransferase [Alphaproteobacteria bacterium]
MVRLTKITTKQGDKGMTMLGDGQMVVKSDQRINAYGTIDEAGASIGVAINSIGDENIISLLQNIQQDLFNVGSVLCRPHDEDKPARNPITQDNITFLENAIETYNQQLEPLNSFILSGGTKPSAYLHLARTVIRRAEREVNLLSQSAYVPENLIIYVNRLSDLLFVLARIMNDGGKNDILWRP